MTTVVNDLTAAVEKLYIEQRSTFRAYLILTDSSDAPIDLTGYLSVRCLLRKRYDYPDYVVEVACTIDPDQVTYKGRIELLLTAQQTTDMPVDPSTSIERTLTEYIYDVLVIQPNGEPKRIMQGEAELSPGVTP